MRQLACRRAAVSCGFDSSSLRRSEGRVSISKPAGRLCARIRGCPGSSHILAATRDSSQRTGKHGDLYGSSGTHKHPSFRGSRRLLQTAALTSTPGVEEIQQIGSGALHLALARGSFIHCARWEGKQRRACAPVPISPGADRSLLLDGRETHGFPDDQVPFILADGGVLGHGGRPSSSIFNEPRGSTSLS